MASLVYKDHFIIALARADNGTGLWRSEVDISWKDEGGLACQLLTGKSFQDKKEAERVGVEMGKDWVDRRLLG
jgi:hypothetical protein